MTTNPFDDLRTSFVPQEQPELPDFYSGTPETEPVLDPEVANSSSFAFGASDAQAESGALDTGFDEFFNPYDEEQVNKYATSEALRKTKSAHPEAAFGTDEFNSHVAFYTDRTKANIAAAAKRSKAKKQKIQDDEEFQRRIKRHEFTEALGSTGVDTSIAGGSGTFKVRSDELGRSLKTGGGPKEIAYRTQASFRDAIKFASEGEFSKATTMLLGGFGEAVIGAKEYLTGDQERASTRLQLDAEALAIVEKARKAEESFFQTVERRAITPEGAKRAREMADRYKLPFRKELAYAFIDGWEGMKTSAAGFLANTAVTAEFFGLSGLLDTEYMTERALALSNQQELRDATNNFVVPTTLDGKSFAGRAALEVAREMPPFLFEIYLAVTTGGSSVAAKVISKQAAAIAGPKASAAVLAKTTKELGTKLAKRRATVMSGTFALSSSAEVIGSQYVDSYKQSINDGISEPEARAIASMEGYVYGVTTLVTQKISAGIAFKALPKEVKTSLGQNIRRTVWSTLKGMGSESIQEIAEESVSDFLVRFAANETEDALMVQALKGNPEAIDQLLLIGTVGGAFGGPMGALSNIGQSKDISLREAGKLSLKHKKRRAKAKQEAYRIADDVEPLLSETTDEELAQIALNGVDLDESYEPELRVTGAGKSGAEYEDQAITPPIAMAALQRRLGVDLAENAIDGLTQAEPPPINQQRLQESDETAATKMASLEDARGSLSPETAFSEEGGENVAIRDFVMTHPELARDIAESSGPPSRRVMEVLLGKQDRKANKGSNRSRFWAALRTAVATLPEPDQQTEQADAVLPDAAGAPVAPPPLVSEQVAGQEPEVVTPSDPDPTPEPPEPEEIEIEEHAVLADQPAASEMDDLSDSELDFASPQIVKARSNNIVRILEQKFGVTREDVIKRISTVTGIDVAATLDAEPSSDLEDAHLQIRTIAKLLLSLNNFDTNIERTTAENGFVHTFAQERGVTVYLFDGNTLTRGIAMGRTAIALNRNLTSEAQARATLFHEFVHVYQEENPGEIAALAERVYGIAPRAVDRELERYASGFHDMNDQREAAGLDPIVLSQARILKESPAVLANVVADFIAADNDILNHLAQKEPGILIRFLDAFLEFIGYKGNLSAEDKAQIAFLKEQEDADFTLQQRVEVAQLYKRLFRSLTNSTAYPDTDIETAPNFDVSPAKGSPMLGQGRKMRTKLQSTLSRMDKDTYSAQELREEFDKDPSLRREAEFRSFDDWYDGYVAAHRKLNPATKKLPKVTREALDEWVGDTQPDVTFTVAGTRQNVEKELSSSIYNLFASNEDAPKPSAALGIFTLFTGQYIPYTIGTRNINEIISRYTGVEYTDVEARVSYRNATLTIDRREPTWRGTVHSKLVTEMWGRRKGLPLQPILHPSGRAIKYATTDSTGIRNQPLLKEVLRQTKIKAGTGLDSKVHVADIEITGPVTKPLGMGPDFDLKEFSKQPDVLQIEKAFSESSMYSSFGAEEEQESELLISGKPVALTGIPVDIRVFNENLAVKQPFIPPSALETDALTAQIHEETQYEEWWYGGSEANGFDMADSDPTDYREVRIHAHAGGASFIGRHFDNRHTDVIGTLVLGSGDYTDDMRGSKNYIAHYRRDMRTDSVSGQKTMLVGEMQFDYQGDKHKYGVLDKKTPRTLVGLEDMSVRPVGSGFIVTNQQTGEAIRIPLDAHNLLATYTDRPPTEVLTEEDVNAIVGGMFDDSVRLSRSMKTIAADPVLDLFDSKKRKKESTVSADAPRPKEFPALPFGDSLSAKQRAKAGYLDLALKQIIKDAVDNGADSIAIPYGDVVDMLWATDAYYQSQYVYDPDAEVLSVRTTTDESTTDIRKLVSFEEKSVGSVVTQKPVVEQPIKERETKTARVPMKEGKLSPFAAKTASFVNTSTPQLNAIMERINSGQYMGVVKARQMGERFISSDLAPAQNRLLTSIRDFFTKGAGRGLGTVVERTTEHGLLKHEDIDVNLMIVQLTNRAIDAVQDQNSDLYIANMDVTPFDANGDSVEESSGRGEVEGVQNTPETEAVNSFIAHMTGIEEGTIPRAIPREGTVLAQAMEIETGEGDLRPRSKHFGNILHTALRSSSQVVRSTASKMTDMEILTRKVEETQARQDQRQYDTLPREYRKNRGEKFFDLMDKVRVAPHEVDTNEKTKGLPAKVRRVLAHFKSRGEDMRLELIDQKREGIRKVARYATLDGIVAIANQHLADDKHWRVVSFQGKSGSTKRIVDSDNNTLTKAEAAEAVAEVAVTDDWGHQYEHIHHAFFGKYRVGYIDRAAYEAARKQGLTHYQARRKAMVTDQNGGDANSYSEAAHKIAQIRAHNANDKTLANKALKNESGDVIYVAIPAVQINDEVTQRMTTAQHSALLSELEKAADLTSDEIFALTRGIVGTKKAKNAFYAAMLERTGAKGYSKDFLRVWSLQTRGFHRYVMARKMRDYVHPRTEEMRARGLHKWAQHFEDLVEFVINPSGDAHISGVEKTLDSVLSRVFGGSSDNEKGLFRGLLPLGHRPLRRMLHLVRSTMYLVTLKTVRQHVVNSFQPLQTVWPVVGELGFVKAVAFYNTPKGKRLIREHGALADPSAFKDSPSGGGFIGTRGLRRIRNMAASVLPYIPWDVRSEVRNQNFAFLALYLHGKRIGLSDTAAAEYGRVRGVVMTQYAFTRTTQPPIMRGPVAATALQYKRFLINQIQLGYGFYKRGFKRDGYGATGYGSLTRFMGVQLVLGGMRGLVPFAFYNMGKNTFCKFMPEYCAGGPPEDDLEQFRLWVKEASGSENLANTVAHGVLAGALGIDISGSLALLDRPYGRNIYEQIGNTVLGPAGNTIIRAVTDQSEKLTQPKSAVEVLGGSLLNSSPAVKAIYEFVDAVSDAELQGKKMYNNQGEFLYEATIKDRFYKMMAFRTMKETEVSAAWTHYDAIFRVYDNAADQMATLAAVDEPDYDRIEELMIKHNAQYPEFPIYFRDLRSRIKNKIKGRTLPRGERFLERTSNKFKQYMQTKYGSTVTDAMEAGQ